MGVAAAEQGHAASGAAQTDVADHTADADRALAVTLRAAVIDALRPAGLNRARVALGMAEAVTVLWTRFLAFDSADPLWPDRDRVVLALEDGPALLAALRHLTGEAQLHGDAGLGEAEAMVGTAGRGLSTAVGLAMAERILAARFGRSLVDHRTWVVASAEEVTAGAGHEAASLAGAWRLAKLTVLAEVAEGHDGPEDFDRVLKRFAGYSWATKGIAADDPHQVAAALAYALRSARPTLILCRPAGVGWEAAEATDGGSGAEPLRAWAEAGRRGARARLAWRRRHQRSPQRDEFDRVMAGRLPEAWRAGLDGWKGLLAADRAATATASASREALATLAAAIPDLVALCAEEGVPGGQAIGAGVPVAPLRAGLTLRVGVRRQAMASAMEGLSRHGGVIPVAETALAFADCLRPALREAALGRRRVIHVLGEDRAGGRAIGSGSGAGDHLAALRAIPNLFVFRPADAVEVAEAWALAAAREDGPSALVLCDTPVPPLRGNHTAENLSARGGYVLAEADGPRQATLIATGAEVAIALGARDILQAQGVAVAVVSLPCFELFAAQDETWRAVVLGGALRVGIEAGLAQGWDRWLGLSGLFLGPGTALPAAREAGAPGQHLNPEGVAQAVLRRLS